jgi:hypothetical protein
MVKILLNTEWSKVNKISEFYYKVNALQFALDLSILSAFITILLNSIILSTDYIKS